jgi:hypothetical protein
MMTEGKRSCKMLSNKTLELFLLLIRKLCVQCSQVTVKRRFGGTYLLYRRVSRATDHREAGGKRQTVRCHVSGDGTCQSSTCRVTASRQAVTGPPGLLHLLAVTCVPLHPLPPTGCVMCENRQIIETCRHCCDFQWESPRSTPPPPPTKRWGVRWRAGGPGPRGWGLC